MSRTPPPLPPHIPGYTFDRWLGGGGMADVYLAYRHSTNRTVAVKVLRDPLAEMELRRRFDQEGRVLAALRHPNIVPVHDIGQANGTMYFALRYLSDGPLSERLEEVRTSARRVVELMAKIVAAMAYSHSQGVIHRDLKPSNVLTDGDEPLVSDFGVAKWASAAVQTVQGTRLGTAAYMCPEMLERGADATGPQADIWSVGVVLYELLTGQLPFRASTDTALLELIQMCPDIHLPPSGAVLPGTDDRLLEILRTALAVSRAERYPTAAALGDELTSWLANARK